jgi:predicted SAM-dependent methyltransferase
MLPFLQHSSTSFASNWNSKFTIILKESYRQVKTFGKKKFHCPICGYYGSFIDISPNTGLRKHAICIQCRSTERHRLQKLVLDEVFKRFNPSKGKILHIAPEIVLASYFKKAFHNYLSIDLYRDDVDLKCDITSMPFKDGEFDFVYASHVLEHVQNDLKALSEIKRVLKPEGIAILPVPIINKTTVEYPEPNPLETFHVRAPGKDYYERYSQIFSRVEQFSSSDFPEKYQTFIYENRSIYPNEACPMRQPSIGKKHIDVVPVCFV